MAKLRIGGVVRYRDLQTPVKNARVRIYDLDSGGNGDDEIFDKTADEQGVFSGTSRDWNDRNTIKIATPLGSVEVETPDLLMLKFRVDADGRSHDGPFVHISDNRSAPLVVPWMPVPVERSGRELLQLVSLSANAKDKALYETIEFGSKAMAGGLLGGQYRQHSVLEARDATLPLLRQRLDEMASRPEIKALDLIFCTHGSGKEVSFFPNEVTPMTAIVAELAKIDRARRRKFRAVFSTACFGASHLDGWLEAGFKVASGGVGIYADSALSFPAFLAAWAAGARFDQAVQAANASDPLRVQESLARAWYESQGLTAQAGQINSVRRIKGDGSLQIDSLP